MGEGHETGDVAGEASTHQHLQDLQAMWRTLDVFQGASTRGRRWEEGCHVRPVCTCSSWERRLRFRPLWSRLGMIRPGLGKGGREKRWRGRPAAEVEEEEKELLGVTGWAQCHL